MSSQEENRRKFLGKEIEGRVADIPEERDKDPIVKPFEKAPNVVLENGGDRVMLGDDVTVEITHALDRVMFGDLVDGGSVSVDEKRVEDIEDDWADEVLDDSDEPDKDPREHEGPGPMPEESGESQDLPRKKYNEIMSLNKYEVLERIDDEVDALREYDFSVTDHGGEKYYSDLKNDGIKKVLIALKERAG